MDHTPLASDITSPHTCCALQAFVGGHKDVSKDRDSARGRQAGIRTPAVKEVSSPNMLCFCLVLNYCSHIYVEDVEAPHHSIFKLEHFQVQSTKTILTNQSGMLQEDYKDAFPGGASALNGNEPLTKKRAREL